MVEQTDLQALLLFLISFCVALLGYVFISRKGPRQ